MSSERLALSRDQYGATPLHKAVLFYQPKLVKLISEKFPLTTKVRRIQIINKTKDIRLPFLGLLNYRVTPQIKGEVGSWPIEGLRGDD